MVPVLPADPCGWPLYWFCGGHGPGETPGPFPNPEAKAWHGDGTALERVWESSTPPHSTSGFPSSVTLREPCFLFPHTGVFLRPLEVFGRRKDCRRDDSSSHWESRDAGGSQEFQGSFLPLSDGGIDWGTMHYFVPKRCVESNKIMYRDKATARQAADQSWRERGTELWVYRCEFCGTWHLTHRDPQSSYTYVPFNQQIKPHSRKKGYKPRRK